MKKLTFLILSIFITTISCEKIEYGDLNQNPYSSTEGNADALLRAGQIQFFSGGGRFYLSNATLYAQYQTQNQYTDEQRYNEAPGFWSNYYTSLMNLKAVTELESDIRGDMSNIKGISEIFSVMIWKRLTDSFGDIPYTAALKASENPSPEYTKQQDIYADLISRAKAARDMLSSSSFTATSDIIYDGDITKWKKYANSLIMSLALQMSKKGGNASTEFAAALTSGPITSNADNFIFTPDVTGGVTNPWSSLRPGDFWLSRTLTDAMQGVAGGANITSNVTFDDRIYAYSSDPLGLGMPYGYADNAGFSATAKINTNVSNSDKPLTIYPAAYTHLMIAEAAELDWIDVDSRAFLRSGIIESFNQWGIDSAKATTYADARLDNASVVGTDQVIGEEKWIALFPSGYDAWAEQRRTGFPKLLPSPEPFNDGSIPERFPYPTEENTINPTNWAIGVQGLVPATDSNSSKIWWNQ
jgi:hypothetical protein